METSVGKNWGTDVVPKEKWIDPKKQYVTKDGKRIEGLNIVLHNSCGDEVTFPVKGTVILREKPRKTKYTIWTLDGRHSVLESSNLDLVEKE